jgi:Family of unknown function (DUF6035)
MAHMLSPSRSLRLVTFDGAIGEVGIEELLVLPPSKWQHWRQKLTEGREGLAGGYRAICAKCGGSVYIRAVKSGNLKHPAFWHYPDGDPYCEWHAGKTINPNDLRRDQYLGQQESSRHKILCDDLRNFLAADIRATDLRCNQKLSSENDPNKWKKPDVYVNFLGVGKVTLELQLSNTFIVEVTMRTAFYNQEGIGLLWIFHRLNPHKDQIPMNFRDVIQTQRGNAFVIDHESRTASVEAKTLILKCFLLEGDVFDAGQLVRLDQITIPAIGGMYFEDRILLPLLRNLSGYRNKWEMTLRDWKSPYIPEQDTKRVWS